ncbi:MAG TPA: hypothetical protein VIJ38_12680 [Acidobacteriaceae bacterium]
MKIRSFPALLASGLLLATATLALSGCYVEVLYKAPVNGYAGRPVPPSKLLQRVLASYTANGTSGGLQIIDGLRDLRGNIQNTTKGFSVSGYSEAQPTTIFNFPEQTLGYVLSATDGNLSVINYSKESGSGTAANFGGYPPSAAASPTGGLFAGAAQQAGVLVISSGGGTFDLNLPNVNKVVINNGSSIVLAMVKNSNSLYRVVKLPSTTNPVNPPGAIDCEPLLLPVFCVVPVAGTYDRPADVSFSLDGSTAYVLNSGPENGGNTASVTFLQTAALNINLIPTGSDPSPLSNLPVANPILIPGGVTAALSDGNYLYLSGQKLQTTGTYKGLFAGNLTLLNLSSYAVSAPISISDGNHTKMLFADDNTLWIGSSQCANGVRAATAAAELAAGGTTDQAGNYNCLTMVTLGSAAPAAQIVPAVTQSATNPVTVPYPNTDQNPYYYGSLTGLCWVQNYHKVYTAYGGQLHAFYTGAVPGTTPVIPGSIQDSNGNVNGGPAGSEIDNINLTVQGTVYDVAYMDAQSNSAN